MKLLHSICVAGTALVCTGAMTSFGILAPQGPVTVPNSFAAGTPARASEVNQNFQALADGMNGNGMLIEQNRQAIEAQSAGRELVRTVAKSGAMFTNIAAALASITDASVDRPYRVEVAPGLYEPNEPLIVPPFVRLSGAGIDTTVVRRAAADGSQNSNAAVITLEDGAKLSDLSVHNPAGSSTFSIGVLGFGLGSASSVVRVASTVDGAGGVGHFAYLFADSDLVVRDSVGRASGGSTANAGLAASNFIGLLTKLRIERCRLESDAGNTGFGMQISRTSAEVCDSYVFGSKHAILTSIDGETQVQGSELRSLQQVLRQDNATTLLMACTKLSGLNALGLASNLRYVHCYKANYSPIVNGFGSSIE